MAGLDYGLHRLGMPPLARSAVLVTGWVAITGGLHLDGAIDAADGLAVPDASRRLTVMSESTVGAFGVINAVILLLLKTAMLTAILTSLDAAISVPTSAPTSVPTSVPSSAPIGLWLMLPLAAGWGRWSQQVAIACFPYVKPTGKGAFHKAAMPSVWDLVPALLLLLGLAVLPLGLTLGGLGLGPSGHLAFSGHLAPTDLLQTGQFIAGAGVAIGVAVWFGRQFGGHTGDTYGAVVEWTEALILVLWALGRA